MQYEISKESRTSWKRTDKIKMFHVKQKEAVEIDSNSLFLFLRATSQAGILHAHLATAAGSLTNIHHPGKFQSDS